MRTRKPALLLAILSCWPLTVQAQKVAKQVPQDRPHEFVKTVEVPDFHNKTLAEVRSLVQLPGKPNGIFADIIPQGPAEGVVVNQRPVPNTHLIPGQTNLVLNLETHEQKVDGNTQQPDPQKLVPPATVDQDSTVNITPVPPSISTELIDILQSEPPWAWGLTAVALAALSTLGVRLIKPTISVVTSSDRLPTINTTLPNGPAIRFSITLRDQIPEPQYQATEPAITRRG